MDYSRNHEPDQQGIWFPYTGWRFKDQYDIRLHDGTVHENVQPNGRSFLNRDGKFADEQVAELRLKPDNELSKWSYKGEGRIKYQEDLFRGY